MAGRLTGGASMALADAADDPSLGQVRPASRRVSPVIPNQGAVSGAKPWNGHGGPQAQRQRCRREDQGFHGWR